MLASLLSYAAAQVDSNAATFRGISRITFDLRFQQFVAALSA